MNTDCCKFVLLFYKFALSRNDEKFYIKQLSLSKLTCVEIVVSETVTLKQRIPLMQIVLLHLLTSKLQVLTNVL